MICPECRQGKHINCTGWAIDPDTDEVGYCACTAPEHPWNREKKP